MSTRLLATAESMFGRSLYRTYWKLEQQLTPGLRSSQYLFAERLAEAVHASGRWLDLGCGRRPFPDWMPEHESRVMGRASQAVGVDPDLASLRDHRAYRSKLAATATALPFRSGAFDLVSANMVVEHLPDPARALAEIRRVLKPNGRFLFHTSNRLHWPLILATRVPERLKLRMVELLEHRQSKDVFPTYYRLNDPVAVNISASVTGFAIERLELVSTSATTVMLGPLVVPELLWIRLLRSPQLAQYRSNLIVTLRRDEGYRAPDAAGHQLDPAKPAEAVN